ncbi:MAG: dual specificity protein phosphatase family protein [Anaerolineales bacterium]|nr:dual specificity protein phosphatase family protein [Anaerolineales bacterium]
MDEIRSWLYIGKFRDTLDKKYLELNRIKSMLQLADPVNQPSINSIYLPVEDLAPTSPLLIKQGIDFILAEKEKGHKVLVACGAGINRSTAFCMAALKEVEGLSLSDAYKDIKRKHPESIPHEPVWESFCSYYNETTPYIDIMRLSIRIF